MTAFLRNDSKLPPCYNDASRTLIDTVLPCPPASRELPSCDHNRVPNLETACCHHAVQEHWMPFLSPNQQRQSTEAIHLQKEQHENFTRHKHKTKFLTI